MNRLVYLVVDRKESPAAHRASGDVIECVNRQCKRLLHRRIVVRRVQIAIQPPSVTVTVTVTTACPH